MGLFDSFYVVDPDDAKLFKNSEGNALFDVELQTKDLECNMDSYYIFKSGLYKSVGTLNPTPRSFSRIDNCLVVSYTYAPTNFSGVVELYNTDKSVKPVLYLDPDGFLDKVSELYPWVRFFVEFEGGRLQKVEAKELTTREELKKTLGPGDVLLEDDNPVAIRHFELMERRNARYR